jgi:6-pyruvoyltetrahydropterin/6-carboxytetrahydropterin synthase
MKKFTASREIGIDAGHRVTNHGSKCKNLHGHRYTVTATVEGDLETSGTSEGMVIDFGILKLLMMKHIDEPCDHGTILWIKDPLVVTLASPGGAFRREDNSVIDLQVLAGNMSMYPDQARNVWSDVAGKLYIVSFVPTAENLAEHWFCRLNRDLQGGPLRLTSVRVDETPNAYAIYTENA